MSYLNHNGKFIASGKAIIKADNRSFRYGDGCFETMRVYNGKLLLKDLHFERLFSSLRALKFAVPATFTPDYLEGIILELGKKNGVSHLGRIRLTIYRSDGGLYDLTDLYPNHIIQAWPLQKDSIKLNELGQLIDIYSGCRKACDELANIKSNNYLPYVMAAIYAKEKKLNDCLLLNTHDKLADSTIANVFIIKNNQITTPALTEGCVAGVTRRHLIQLLHLNGIKITEKAISILELMHADEIFLTNSVSGVKWVSACGTRKFKNKAVKQIHSLLNLSLMF